MSDTWDVVVVGAGPAGENAAQYAIAGSDRTAVLVEAELVGGECSYWACMPSKALLRPVELASAVAALPGAPVGPVGLEAVLARRDAFTSHHDDGGQVGWAEGIGIDVVRGRGRLVGERTVEVTAADGTTRTLHARHAVVLATGTTAAVPPVPGLADALPWTSRDVTNLTEVPRRVAVVGGGVVACESATWLSGLGAEEVTVVEQGPRLLARLEPFAGELVAEGLAARGVTVLTGTRVSSASRPGAAATGIGRIHGGEAAVTVAGHGDLVVDEVVVAAGRAPGSVGLGLEAVGVAAAGRGGPVPPGYVATDDHLRVLDPAGAPVPWLYAIGDLNGRALLTHMGKYQGRIAGDVIAAVAEGRPLDGDRHVDRADDACVPAVVFADPQVGSVGLTEAEARDRGIDVECVEYDQAAVSGSSLLRDGYRGRAKLVIDRGADVVVGATFVGSEVGELVHAATVAIVGRVGLGALWHAVPSYPTQSEVWLRLLEARRGG